MLFVLLAAGTRSVANERAKVIVVVGAPGEDEYATVFAQQVEAWNKVCAQAGAKPIVIGAEVNDATSDRDRVKLALEAETKTGADELWIVLVGHGTFNGKEAKFNLRGLDLAATDLAEWLKPFQRPLAIIDTASASAPFLSKLAGKGRVVVSSTRSGNEQNYARFGKFLRKRSAIPRATSTRMDRFHCWKRFSAAPRGRRSSTKRKVGSQRSTP